LRIKFSTVIKVFEKFIISSSVIETFEKLTFSPFVIANEVRQSSVYAGFWIASQARNDEKEGFSKTSRKVRK